MNGEYYRLYLLPGNIPVLAKDNGFKDNFWQNIGRIFHKGMILAEEEALFFQKDGEVVRFSDMKKVTDFYVQTEIMSLCFTFIEGRDGKNSWRLCPEITIWINGRFERFETSNRWFGERLLLNPVDGLVVLSDKEKQKIFSDLFTGSEPNSTAAVFHQGMEKMYSQEKEE